MRTPKRPRSGKCIVAFITINTDPLHSDRTHMVVGIDKDDDETAFQPPDHTDPDAAARGGGAGRRARTASPARSSGPILV